MVAALSHYFGGGGGLCAAITKTGYMKNTLRIFKTHFTGARGKRKWTRNNIERQ